MPFNYPFQLLPMRPALLCLVVLVFFSAGCARGGTAAADVPASTQSASLDSLRARLTQAAAAAEGRVGAAVALLGTDEAVAVAGDERFPMQSVFKLPLAMALLDAVDRGRSGSTRASASRPRTSSRTVSTVRFATRTLKASRFHFLTSSGPRPPGATERRPTYS